jgi:predicted Zn-dependent protease
MRAVKALAMYFIILFVAIGGLFVGCAGVQSAGGGFNLISMQQEWKLGNRLSRDIARKSNLITDPSSSTYINQLGQRIVQQTPFRNLPWQFHIIQDKEINAFNIPGGHVYVYTGLIQTASMESELAGVMAHEIGHGVSRHATEALSAQLGLSLLTSLVLGKNPSTYEKVVAQIVGNGYLAKYSRNAEREADKLGTYYVYQAGFDPNGIVIFFQKLLEEERRRPSLVEKLFSTHPLTQERIRNVNYEISQFPPKPNLITDEPQFQAFKSNLFGGSTKSIEPRYDRGRNRSQGNYPPPVPRRYRY